MRLRTVLLGWRGVVLLGVISVLVGGCNSSEPVPTAAVLPTESSQPQRFVFLTNGDDPFFDALFAGLQDGAKRFDLEKHGLTVVMEKNNGTAQGQIE